MSYPYTIISVHVPKTGGLSFRAMLEEQMGDRFLPDYDDVPLAHPHQERQRMATEAEHQLNMQELEGIECVHGHFLPVKYRPLAAQRECSFVAWLREPLARLASHYYYWQRTYDPQSSDTSAVQTRMMEDNWSLEDFCLAPELRNIYAQFFWSFPLQDFDFIGITEHFDEDFRYFCTAFLGKNLQPQRLNQRDPESRDAGLSDAAVHSIRAFHAEDVALYDEALQLREARMGAGILATGS